MICEPADELLVWLDGDFVPWKRASMNLTDHHYGVGVFEGVRAYATETGTAVFRLIDHTARLLRSAHILKLRLPDGVDLETLCAAQVELLQRNALSDAYLRPFVFHSGVMGLRPSLADLKVRVAVLALSWRAPGGGETRAGLKLASAPVGYQPAAGALVKAKANASYFIRILALEEVRAAGADDVLLYDAEGFVTETSGANLFIVTRGELHTPPSVSVLDGITRDTVRELAGNLGIAVHERRMSREDVYVADEAFLTGTATEVAAVRSLDRRQIGSGLPGPVTTELQAAYAACVRGRGHARRTWLTSVEHAGKEGRSS